LTLLSPDNLESLRQAVEAQAGLTSALPQADADYDAGRTVSGDELRQRFGLET
jgi:antitoxin YefM